MIISKLPKLALFSLVLLFVWNLQLHAQEIAEVKILTIESKALNQTRQIMVFTPQGYQENTLVNYEVMYVFDAQNREFFDFVSSAVSFVSQASRDYIVVGISSPYYENPEYARNNDMLPVLKTESGQKRFGSFSGNADNFLMYVKDEVVPLIESSYRTRQRRTAVGHSLSASLVIYSMLEHPSLFQNYLAISPNFAYDEDALANAFMNFDFDKLQEPNFLFLSNANEGESYWHEWRPAREKVYNFLNANDITNLTSTIRSFPDLDHWSTFATSLLEGLKVFFEYDASRPVVFSEESYEIMIKVKVLSEDDEIYITGNQEALGNWNPDIHKLKRTSPLEREIRLKVKAPTEFKFTRGTWSSEAFIDALGGPRNIRIDPEKKKKFEFEIIGYGDRQE